MNRNSAIFWVLYMSGMLGGNLYVFFAWKGRDTITQSEQTTLSLSMGLITFFGGVLIFFIKKLKIEADEKQKWAFTLFTPNRCQRLMVQRLKKYAKNSSYFPYK